MTSRPREAEARLGPVGAVLCRIVFLAVCLPGPVLLAVAVVPAAATGRSAADFWGLLAGGVLATVVGGVAGVFGWQLVGRSRRDARLLASDGVAATAEILTVADHLSGEDPGLELMLWISGPGFAAFEARTVRYGDPTLVPGMVLGAVVVPAELLYSVG
ncbi:hypothetical protein [Catellatospora methionotrophica]|uniref:hypothetical protein n=1 Tax=Catellatospora methionotrophica TaxID=121620 RepID=UPI0033F2C1B7